MPPPEATDPFVAGSPLKRRLEALGQLQVIEAATADKVRALTVALGDGVGTAKVIAALEKE